MFSMLLLLSFESGVSSPTIIILPSKKFSSIYANSFSLNSFLLGEVFTIFLAINSDCFLEETGKMIGVFTFSAKN